MKYPLHPFWQALLLPFSLLYVLGVGVRNMLYDLDILKVHEFDLPVISVGNITVGGTGKTPHVEYLIRMLAPRYRVAVLSRGYRRKTRGFLAAGPESTVEELGDEPYQIHKKFPEVQVIVDEKRARALKMICEEMPGIEIVILDDAFQHRAVKPGLSVLLIDYNLPLSKELYLPAGRMRESRHEKKRADLVVFTKCPGALKPIEERIRVKHFNPFPYQRVYFTKIVYGSPRPVFGDETGREEASGMPDRETTVLAVSGIANPGPFVQYVKTLAGQVEELSFPDHYRFRKKDIEKIGRKFEEIKTDKKMILTTEKDAMRLAAFCTFEPPFRDRWFYIPIEVDVLQKSEREDFEYQILKYVESHQRNRGIHQK